MTGYKRHREMEVYLTTFDGTQHLRLHGWLKRNDTLIKTETIIDDDEQFGGEDTGSVFSIPDEFLESQPEDQITMLLELTRTMR